MLVSVIVSFVPTHCKVAALSECVAGFKSHLVTNVANSVILESKLLLCMMMLVCMP